VRSRPEPCGWPAALLLGCALCLAPACFAQQAEPPQLTQVEAAKQSLRADPNLGLERTMHTLRWHSSDDEKAGDADRPRWLPWFAGLFRWIGQSGRLVVWVLAAMLAAGIVVYLLRLLRDRGPRDAAAPSLAPTHVRELDIRPQSLPADIGAAYAAPVRESTTEGESVTLARGCLPASGGEFAAALVRTWQFAVYGGRMPETDTVHALCAGFAPALDRAAVGSNA
jgi:hypothetical protein